MHAQTLIVALLVTGCALHATWRLMPAALRGALTARLLRSVIAFTFVKTGCDS